MQSPYDIQIETNAMALRLWVDESSKLYQKSFGAKDAPEQPPQPAYPASGDGWFYEPALQITHADGNTSTDLRVVEASTEGDLTTISLKDPEYSFYVNLYFRVYPSLDVLESWSEIHHNEADTIILSDFASSTPDFGATPCWLTQFHGDWNDEVHMREEELSYGIKVLDSKLGVRAHQFRSPWFLLARGGPAQEDSGEVFAGSLAWSGSFAFKFEVDPYARVRALCGINPFASTYQLPAHDKFETPKMVWAWSNRGTGPLSRNLHRWVRDNALREGNTPRAILLNNWEATYFSFDEQKIVSLIDGAKSLGMDLFLLDDGWFGNKYPRDHDGQGLGDWEPDPAKLPNGIGALTRAAEDRGIRFGIWLEPEMVNPKSELFENHPDWAIQQPKRAHELSRNQMILDITRPEVCEYVFNIADNVLGENPGISYVKWDCNRYITQPGSPSGSHLWIDYVHALYSIFQRLVDKYPNVEIMMCSGGGGRVDYAATRFSHEIWPSDHTDPAGRVLIQWGYSYFFPSIAVSAHVTSMGARPLKFAFDVAMSGRLGMDMDLDKLSLQERAFAAEAIEVYKSIREVVQLGDLFRLESPYAGNRTSLIYVHRDHAVLFVYSLGTIPESPLKLKGLDPAANYQLEEINLVKGEDGNLGVWTGEQLSDPGLDLPPFDPYESSVFKLTRTE
jgi:alpha-galactosidase